MRKNHSVNVTMLEMCTRFLKLLRKKDVDVYRLFVHAKHFASAQYTIGPRQERRVFFDIICENNDRTYTGAHL